MDELIDKVKDEVAGTVPAEVRETPLGGCLVRLLWLFVGHAALAVFLVVIAVHSQALVSVASIGYWVVVGLVVVARFVDVTHCDGMLSDGTMPATLRDATRFSAWLVILAGVAWGLAHALGSMSWLK